MSYRLVDTPVFFIFALENGITLDNRQFDFVQFSLHSEFEDGRRIALEN